MAPGPTPAPYAPPPAYFPPPAAAPAAAATPWPPFPQTLLYADSGGSPRQAHQYHVPSLTGPAYRGGPGPYPGAFAAPPAPPAPPAVRPPAAGACSGQVGQRGQGEALPLRYIEQCGFCPGFNNDGSKDPAQWLPGGEVLTRAAKDKWVELIDRHRLPLPSESGARAPDFRK